MVEASSLKRGDFIVHDGEPYFVEKSRAVVIAKHSHTKMKIDLKNIFTGDKKTLSAPNHEDIEIADIIRKHGQLISKTEEGRGQVMDMVDYGTLDAEIKKPQQTNPKELEEYALIGFGSGIYSDKHHRSLFDLVEKLPRVSNKRAFIFSTSGAPAFAFDGGGFRGRTACGIPGAGWRPRTGARSPSAG